MSYWGNRYKEEDRKKAKRRKIKFKKKENESRRE